MKRIPVILIAALAMMQLQADECVLFDASSTPLSAIHKYNCDAFSMNNAALEVRTKGNTGYPGITLRGQWDLSNYTRLVVYFGNRISDAALPLTICLSNPDADIAKQHGVFIDRQSTKGKAIAPYTFELPPPNANLAAITPLLTGMRRTPMSSVGLVAALDPKQVTSISIYLKQPKLDWTWAITRIVAQKGEPRKIEPWMQMTKEQFFPFIDQYGQFKHKEWPGKVHSDAELKANAQKETADLAAHPGPQGWNAFGGWAAGPKQKATGHFRVQKIGNTWWFVDPEGCLWWSHGPVRVTPSTAITPLDNRAFYFENLPKEDSPFALFYTTHDELLKPYYEKRNILKTYDFSSANAYRKYGENWYAQFAERAHTRLRSWGMNTIANSSDKKICFMDKTPYINRFELKSKRIEGSHDGWWPFRDPFDASFRQEVVRQMKIHQREMEDPWCFGFFVDNELSWGGPTDLATWTLESPADQAAKIEFISRLRKQYVTIDKLNAVWGETYASWEDMLALKKRPGKGATQDLTAFTRIIAESYFKNINEEFKKLAPNKLYMGCRFAGRGPEWAVVAGAKHCDLISYNIYAKTLADFTLPAGIDKPVIIGEFHFGALDRGLFHPGLIETKDQNERARVYVQYVTSALQHPNVVGVHWHQFGDQATTGRFDGENFQVGFVDCCDTPYPETIAALRTVGYDLYSTRMKAAARK